MSNPIRFDSLLVRALSTELHTLLAGRSAHPFPTYHPDGSATLQLDRQEALRFDLHPQRGWVRLVGSPPTGETDVADCRIQSISAPPDERLLRIEMRDEYRFSGAVRTLVVELHTNQWNALLIEGEEGRIVSALRARSAGARSLHPGTAYLPPPPLLRCGPPHDDRAAAWVRWSEKLAPLPGDERPRALVEGFMGASLLNAAAIVGEDEDLGAAFERWWALVAGSESRPVLLRQGEGVQPYPFPLPAVPHSVAASLLDAMNVAASTPSPAASNAAVVDEETLDRVRGRAAAARRRITRLEGEIAAAGEADRIRHLGDVLLSHLHLVPPGASSIVLPDFSGGEVTVRLDPSLKAAANAERLYGQAKRKARAEAIIPELLEAARTEALRWEAALASAEAGALPEWAVPLLRSSAKGREAKEVEERRPYRLYRTSGGVEVRVGRTSRDNDRLTFGHSSPDDVWLHARSVAGSHVILRWSHADAPPARDLQEAAGLAALFSKARSSGTVAVDWTRRKHVRKPRGAPPGSVSLLRAKTVFVGPDEALEERLRVG